MSDYLALDLLYVVMMAAVSISPVTYILATPVIRAAVAKIFAKRSRNKKSPVTDKNIEEGERMQLNEIVVEV